MTDSVMQTLWIGEPLSKIEQLCLKSFIDNGHIVHLYVYDKVENIPEGVVVKDGNEILDKSEIFTYKNGSVSAFSNLFRFSLLFKKGGYWIDTDLLCVRPIQNNDPFLFSSEPDEFYKKTIINAGIIKMPKGSEAALLGFELQQKRKEDIINGKIIWCSGPKTVSEIVKKFNLEKYVLPWKGICNCYCHDFEIIYDINHNNPLAINSIQEIPEEMICIHLWNELLRRKGMDKNMSYHPDSIIEFFKRKHNIN